MKTQATHRKGFTLVELLVVIGIIALLIAILLPTLNQARRSARDIQCGSNMGQLSKAMLQYANAYKGKFAPNVFETTPGRDIWEWYHVDRIGQFLPKPIVLSTGNIAGPILICPNDDTLNAQRCYAMNFWASSDVTTSLKSRATNGTSPRSVPYGTFWGTNAGPASNLILFAERFTNNGSDDNGWFATSTVGFEAGLSGTSTPSAANRFGQPYNQFSPGLPMNRPNGTRFPITGCDIDFSRHRTASDRNRPRTDPFGRANFSFADGSVRMLTHQQCVVDLNGTPASSLEAMWSPHDREMR